VRGDFCAAVGIVLFDLVDLVRLVDPETGSSWRPEVAGDEPGEGCVRATRPAAPLGAGSRWNAFLPFTCVGVAAGGPFQAGGPLAHAFTCI